MSIVSNRFLSSRVRFINGMKNEYAGPAPGRPHANRLKRTRPTTVHDDRAINIYTRIRSRTDTARQRARQL